MVNLNKEPLTLSNIAKINYSKYLLETNPFPSIEIPGVIPITTADRVDILEQFKRTLTNTVFDKTSGNMILIGEYGSGKSHILKYFQSIVNKELLNSKNKTLAIYVKSVGRNFRDLFLYFIDDIGRDFLRQLAEDFLKTYFQKLGHDELKKYIIDKELKQSNNLLEEKISDILSHSRFYDLFFDVVKSMPKLRKNSTAYALLHLAHPDYSSHAWRWLIGENLSSDERRVIRVEDNISDPIAAEAILDDFMKLFMHTGINTVVLLIDEFENFTLIPKNLRDRFMEGLRHFIDDNPQGVFLAFTTTPFAWTELTVTTNALVRRLAGNELELQFFTREYTEELISRYNKLFRLNDKDLPESSKKYNTNLDIFPFTTEAIDKIFNESHGLVAVIIKLCRRAIDLSLDEGLPIVDEKIIDQITK